MKKTFAPQLLALCLALVTLLSLAGCKQAETGDTPDSRTPAEEEQTLRYIAFRLIITVIAQ